VVPEYGATELMPSGRDDVSSSTSSEEEVELQLVNEYGSK
jgi:hypothetical protein